MAFRDHEEATIDRLAKDKSDLEDRVAYLREERDTLRDDLRRSKMRNAGLWLKRFALLILCFGVAVGAVAAFRFVPQKYEAPDPHEEERNTMTTQCNAVCSPHTGAAEWDVHYKLQSCICDMRD